MKALLIVLNYHQFLNCPTEQSFLYWDSPREASSDFSPVLLRAEYVRVYFRPLRQRYHVRNNTHSLVDDLALLNLC